jgi:signal transduction histidine kinase
MDKEAKKSKKTKTGYKAWLYILTTIGYLLLAAGIVIVAFFSDYVGQSRKDLNKSFTNDAIDLYSVAALTGDSKDLDYKNSNFHYMIIKGISGKELMETISNKDDLPATAEVVDKNLTDEEYEALDDYRIDRKSLRGSFRYDTYIWSDKMTYSLSYDNSFLKWPYSKGDASINEWAGSADDVAIHQIGLNPKKKGLYLIDDSDGLVQATAKNVYARVVFKNYSVYAEYDPFQMTFDEMKKDAVETFKNSEITKPKEYTYSIELYGLSGKYASSRNPNQKHIVYQRDIELLDSASAQAQVTYFNGAQYSYDLRTGRMNTYTVVSIIPDKLSAKNDLFNRIAPAAANIHVACVLAIIGIIAGIICFVTGVILFLRAAGHVAVPVHPEKEWNIRKLTDTDYIERRGFARIPLDLGFFIYILAMFAALAAICIGADTSDIDMDSPEALLIILPISYLVVPVTAIYLYSWAVNVKLGKFWKNTVIYKLIALIPKAAAKVKENEAKKRTVADLNRRGQIYYFTDLAINVFLGILAVLTVWDGYVTGVILALAIFIVKEFIKHHALGRIVRSFAVVKTSAAKIASGELSYKAGTEELPVDIKQVQDDLNSIGDAIDSAVDERLKSERMQTELITNVSHDIRTPLTSIINYTDLLSKPDVTSEQKKEYLEVLKKQSSKLKKLINDLIDASKAESGKLVMHPEIINAGTVIDMMAGEYQEKLKAKDITLETSGTENDSASIIADPNYLGRVFQNLFGNMYKYSQPGTRAYVDLDEKDSKITIIFRNISSERLHITADELTERFVRGDISRTTEGSGLGLSIAKNLTELMGGEFNVTIDGDLFKVELIFPGS